MGVHINGGGGGDGGGEVECLARLQRKRDADPARPISVAEL